MYTTTEMSLPVGSRVRLNHPYSPTAVVVEVHDQHPEGCCGEPAYTVRREPGNAPEWPRETAVWHAADVRPPCPPWCASHQTDSVDTTVTMHWGQSSTVGAFTASYGIADSDTDAALVVESDTVPVMVGDFITTRQARDLAALLVQVADVLEGGRRSR